MKKLILIIGPQAVGKMTVGQELSKLTGLKLFHNHMTLDLVSQFFNVHEDKAGMDLNVLVRNNFFEAIAKSDLQGLIVTNVIDFDNPDGVPYARNIIEIFEAQGGRGLVVELVADADTRMARNKTENRVKHKPWAGLRDDPDGKFRYIESRGRANTRDDEKPFENHLKIDNTNIAPAEVAKIIVERLEKEELCHA